MESLYLLSSRRVERVSTRDIRYLYDKINWDNRLIVIKGAKGVGKTTLMLQRIKLEFDNDPDKALYVSMDHMWFLNNSLLSLAEHFYTRGGTHLFLDEVHKYPHWAREIKNIYDYYPDLHLIVSGSSMLRLETEATADLSRRYRGYTLQGLSFREYLKMEGIIDLQPYTLEQILSRHVNIATKISSEIRPLAYFGKYLKEGYYPFYKEEGDGFADRLQSTIDNVVEVEIPTISNIEYESVYKIKRLMMALSQTTPYTLNVTNLSRSLQVSRNTLLKLLGLMEKATLIRQLFSATRNMEPVTKPEKILFDNTNISYTFGGETNIGTVRETFVTSQLQSGHTLSMPNAGDLIVDNRYLFEVGGRKKGYSQIKDVTDSFVVGDNIEIGNHNKIPLWLFGFLY